MFRVKLFFLFVVICGFTIDAGLCRSSSSQYDSGLLDLHPEAKNAWNKGELDLAIKLVEQETKGSPENADIESLQKALTLQKKRMDRWLEKASQLIEAEDYDTARETLSMAAIISPSYPQYLLLLARLEDAIYPKEIIFDGTSLGERFSAYDHDGKFETLAGFDDGYLHIDVPAETRWGRVGFESKEPVAIFNSIKDDFAYRFQFDFKNEKTTGYIIDLDAIDSKADIRIVYKEHDESKRSLLLKEDYLVSHESFLPQELKKRDLTLVIQPDQYTYAEMGGGFRVQTSHHLNKLPEKGYKLRIQSISGKAKQPTELALQSISLSKVPIKTQKDLSNLKRDDTELVLFDGKSFVKRWFPYPLVKEYSRFNLSTQLMDEGLLVNNPEKTGWGKVGIVSPAPVIWLDELDNEATEITVRYSFIEEKTDGFLIMAGDINPVWKDHGRNVIKVFWSKAPDEPEGRLKIHRRHELVYDEPGGGRPPAEISLHFKKGQFGVEGDGLARVDFPFSYMTSDSWLHLWATLHTGKKNSSSRMGLKQIILTRNIAEPKTTGDSIALKPLSENELFSSQLNSEWECFAGKEAATDCIDSSGVAQAVFTADDKAVKGISSKSAVVHLDKRRINKGQNKITFQFDSKKTNNFELVLEKLHLSLIENETGDFSLQFDGVKRTVDREWLLDKWSGKAIVLMGKNWVKAGLEGGKFIHLFKKPKEKQKLIVQSYLPKGKKQGVAGEFVLKNISSQWQLPEDATSAERWNYLDDADFDPEAFLIELKGAMQ